MTSFREYITCDLQVRMLHECMNIIFHEQDKQICQLSIFKVALTFWGGGGDGGSGGFGGWEGWLLMQQQFRH